MYVKVTVLAGSKKEYLKQVGDKRLEVAIKAKAKQNLANRAVITKLAEFYNISPSQIRLINGHHTPRKMFDIHNEDGAVL